MFSGFLAFSFCPKVDPNKNRPQNLYFLNVFHTIAFSFQSMILIKPNRVSLSYTLQTKSFEIEDVNLNKFLCGRCLHRF